MSNVIIEPVVVSRQGKAQYWVAVSLDEPLRLQWYEDDDWTEKMCWDPEVESLQDIYERLETSEIMEYIDELGMTELHDGAENILSVTVIGKGTTTYSREEWGLLYREWSSNSY